MGTAHEHALFSLQYQVAKLRGGRGHPDFAEWSKKARKIEKRGGDLVDQVLSAKDAVDVLAQAGTPWLKTQAVAVAAEGYLSTLGDDNKNRAEYTAHLERLKRGAIEEASKKSLFIPEKQKKADRSASAKIAVPKADFKWIKRSYGPDGVTRVSGEGSGSVEPRREGFKYYVEHADPRNWSGYVGTTFRRSYETARNPAKTLSDPPASIPSNNGPGTAWKGLLFEFATPGLTPEMTEYRNIININFTVTHAHDKLTHDKLTLVYSLNECLTTSVLGIENEGGIDVDSGEGGVTLEKDKLTVTAEKDIRFTEAAAFGDELNILALPFLMVFIRSLILEPLK